jgi:opacity protein-like surface antigen
VTGEWRGKANFHGLDIVNVPGNQYPDEYHGSKSEALFLANVYADLGTWWCLTPFVGVGIGTSLNTISSFTDTNVPLASVAYGMSASQWNFAWAAHAGVAYRVNNNFTVELAYRYVDLGNARSGDLVNYFGGNTIYNPMEFRTITSQDLRIGVRWNCCDVPPPPPPPLVRKG